MDVGNIVATLTLKKGEWDQSIAAVKKDNQDLGGFVLNNEKTFKAMGTAMTVAGTAIVGSIGLMVKSFADAGSGIYDLSLKTGFSTESLSEWKYMAGQCGGSLDDVEIAAKKMANTITDADNGLKTATDTFDKLGISIDDIKNMKPEDQFNTLATAIAAIENPTKKASMAQDVFGKSSTNLLPIFAEGKTGMNDMREAAHKLAVVFDTETAKKADALGDAQDKLKTAFAGVGQSIATTLAPALTSLATKITGLITNVQSWIQEHPTLVSWITKGGVAIGGLMMALGPLIIALPGLIKSFGLLKAAITPVGSAVLVVSAAFVGWNIGQKIGEIELLGTSINTHITNAFTKAYDAIGLFKGSAEKATEAEVLLSTATKIAGQEVTNKALAMDIIRQKYAEAGTVGNQMLDDWASKSKDADLTAQALSMTVAQQTDKIDAHVKSVGLTKDELEALKKKQEEWNSFLKDNNIVTLVDQTKKIDELTSYQEKLKLELASGQITQQEYEKGMKSLNDQLDTLSKSDADYTSWMKDYGIGTIQEKTDRILDLKNKLFDLDVAVSTNKITAGNYLGAVKKINNELVGLTTGIYTDVLPASRNMDEVWGQAVSSMKSNTTGFKTHTGTELTGRDGIKDKWLGLYADITRDWGNKLKEWSSGVTTFKDFLSGTWDSAKTTFARFVADLASEWSMNFLKKIVTGVADAVFGKGGINEALSSVGTVGTNAADKVGKSFLGLSGPFFAAVGMIGGVFTAFLGLIGLLSQGEDQLTTWLREHPDYRGAPSPKVGGPGGYYEAQHGMERFFTEPALIRVHPQEYVSIKPASAMGGSTTNKSIVNNITMNISTENSRDMERWARGEGKEIIKELFRQNLGGITEKTETYLKTYRK